jgi:peptide/nickel transport system permease protein
VTRFLLGRAAWSLLVLWFVLSASFGIATLLPADPAAAMVGPHASAETVERLRKQMCLDRPILVQYRCFVVRIAQGDLGTSFRTRRPVTELLLERLWPTAQLAFAAMVLQLAIGVPIGIYAAVRRRRLADIVAQILAFVGQSAPTFFLGPIFIFLLAYRFDLFPVSGYGEGGWDRLRHLFLPALTLASTGIALYARLVRSDMIEILGEDYVRTARAKGLSEPRVVLRHAFRNAMVSVVTVAGLELGGLMAGAIVTESVFAWPGLGREAVQSILQVDLPVILGVVLTLSVAITITSLLVDVLYSVLDPRIRLE